MQGFDEVEYVYRYGNNGFCVRTIQNPTFT